MKGRFLTAMAAVLLAVSAQAAETLKVDRAHSFVNFEIKHTVSSVTGAFNDFAGTIQFDSADPTQSAVELTIQTASVDTGVEARDNHLRTPDFFDAEKNPQITFKSKRVAKKSGDVYDVTGDFTMHGVTKEITIPVTFLGSIKGRRGEVFGFRSDFKVNRLDYGVGKPGEGALGDDVEVRISLQAGAPPPPKPAEGAADKPAEKK